MTHSGVVNAWIELCQHGGAPATKSDARRRSWRRGVGSPPL